MAETIPVPSALSLGMSDFAAIRREGAIYVDKTDMIFELTRLSRSYFLSRPRRFGKSLLVSTLENFFLGRKELFRGLKIFEMEEKTARPWTKFPVFKFDFAGGNFEAGVAGLNARLDTVLDTYETTYGIPPGQRSKFPAERLARLLIAAEASAGRPSVVLVDEYDRPLEAATGEEREQMRTLLKNFWGVLKGNQDRLRFVLFTGVTKYQKVSIFSELNNLVELTWQGRYSTLCGLTRDEIERDYDAHIDEMAACIGMTRSECMAELERHYDGYHFTWPSPGVYNPYSLLTSLNEHNFGNYWFQSGTPGSLPKRIVEEGFDMTPLMDGNVSESVDNLSDLAPGGMSLVPLLFQSGYLTLKGPADDFQYYPLGFPNDEVRQAFTRQLAPMVLPILEGNSMRLMLNDLTKALQDGDFGSCLAGFKSIFASLPYDRGNAKGDPIEVNFPNAIYIVFTLLGIAIRTEVSGARGVCDAIVETVRHAYVIEFKRDCPAADALGQVKAKGYADRFASAAKSVHLVGVSFSTKTRNVGEWVEELAPR